MPADAATPVVALQSTEAKIARSPPAFRLIRAFIDGTPGRDDVIIVRISLSCVPRSICYPVPGRS
jgi:hypothetical protein